MNKQDNTVEKKECFQKPRGIRLIDTQSLERSTEQHMRVKFPEIWAA